MEFLGRESKEEEFRFRKKEKETTGKCQGPASQPWRKQDIKNKRKVKGPEAKT